MFVHVNVYDRIWDCVLCVNLYICMCTCVCVYMSKFVCGYMCEHVYICIFYVVYVYCFGLLIPAYEIITLINIKIYIGNNPSFLSITKTHLSIQKELNIHIDKYADTLKKTSEHTYNHT